MASANSKVVHALLRDSSGSILVIRRRGSALWSLPGGSLRANVVAEDLLTTYCQRQVGITPDFDAAMEDVVISGIPVVLAKAEVPRARAGARGRIDAVSWVVAGQLPYDMEPVARLAVGMFAPDQEAGSVVEPAAAKVAYWI